MVTCETKGCERNATVHFMVPVKRSCVEIKHYCEEHAPAFWQTFLKGDNYAGTKEDAPINEVPFSFDLLAYDEIKGMGWVYLWNGPRCLIGRVGYAEVTILYNLLAGTKLKRPMTHEAFVETIRFLGGEITKVIFGDFCEDDKHFLAKVELRQGTRHLVLDLNPSDAVALALVANIPILVAPIVIQKSCMNTEQPFTK